MRTLFLTGFPGFLGSELLPRLLSRDPDTRAACLVQPKYLALARQRAAELEAAHPALAGRIELALGDITRPGLGLDDAGRLATTVAEIHHLAAIYDLSVRREVAEPVNVEGTRHVLDFAGRCPRLERLHYVSTCYVSGRYPGTFHESDLDVGQTFNNAYEATKYRAEILVQSAMQAGLPATIYRPAIVVGDSRSGATQKYDGPYFVMQWLLRQPRVAVMPVISDTRRYALNVVPRDFVVDAIAALSARVDTVGGVFHLADPAPLTVDRMIDVLARATDRRVVRLPLPKRLAKLALAHVPGVYRLLRIPASAIDYFVHPTHYATAATEAALAPSGVRCPPFEIYAERLVAFMRAHPQLSAAPMA
jgi:thioester reductase-like protein